MQRSRIAIAALAAVAAAGCPRSPAPEAPEEPREAGEALDEAAMPFHVLEVPGGAEVEWDAFAAELEAASAVCLGEEHGNPHHHWAQLQVVEAVFERWQSARAALGMEMFQRPFQGVLDDYAEGRIDEDTMLSRTGWEERWGHDYALYRPAVRAAVEEEARILALNAPREVVRKVSREGFEALSPSERERLPELDLGDPEHYEWFWDVMDALEGEHPRGGSSEDGETEGAHGEAGAHGEGGAHGEAGAHSEGDGDAREHANGRASGGGEGEGANGDPGSGGADLELGDGDALVPAEELGELEGLDADDRLYAAQVIWDEAMAEGTAEFLAEGEDRRAAILAGNGHCHDSAIARRIERRGPFEAVSVLPVIDAGEGEVARALAQDQHDYLFVLDPPEGAGH